MVASLYWDGRPLYFYSEPLLYLCAKIEIQPKHEFNSFVFVFGIYERLKIENGRSTAGLRLIRLRCNLSVFTEYLSKLT